MADDGCVDHAITMRYLVSGVAAAGCAGRQAGPAALGARAMSAAGPDAARRSTWSAGSTRTTWGSTRRSWGGRDPRIEEPVDRLLRLFARRGVHATFFVLGWVAARHGDVVRRIAADGHEIASHGYLHRRLDALTPVEFREDVERTSEALERCIGRRPIGYRAPSFTVLRSTMWALDELLRCGMRYDSSIFPIDRGRLRHRRLPRAPAAPDPPSGRSDCRVPADGGRRARTAGAGGRRRLPAALSAVADPQGAGALTGASRSSTCTHGSSMSISRGSHRPRARGSCTGSGSAVPRRGSTR